MRITISVQNVAEEYIRGLLHTEEVKGLIDLPETLVEQVAEANHEAWRKAKVADGYSFGEVVDDTIKTHPLLIAYSELSDKDKEENRRNAREALILLKQVGCHISKEGQPASKRQIAKKVREIMELLHDSWAREKALKGYHYAEKRNDDLEKGTLTHRDMLPFSLLLKLYPHDADYDFQTARGVVKAVEDAGYIICVD